MSDSALAWLEQYRAHRLTALTERLVDTILAENPAYRTSTVVPEADLRISCHDNLDRLLELLTVELAGGAPERAEDDPAFDAARATGERRARQGLPLDQVLRSFRMGGRLIWQDVVREGEQVLDAQTLRDIGGHLWEVVDATSAQVAVAYHQHLRAVVRANEQQRAELWEGLLAGRAHEPGYALEVAALLDVPDGVDLVVVAAPALDPAQAEEVLAPHASAWTRRSTGVVGLVALRESDPAGVRAQLLRLAARAESPVGVSGVQHGLAGVAEGFRQATVALRMQGERVGLGDFAAQLPEALLLSAPEVAARLVDRWVGPLGVLDPAETAVLVQTLEVWVSCGGSPSRAAQGLHCHRNTVLNRLRRWEQLTGRDPVSGGESEALTDLDLALRAYRLGLGSLHNL